MLEIIEAIQAGKGCSFKRCAVEPFEHPEHGPGFVFWSPRNDYEVVGWVPREHAKAMAHDFLEEVRCG